MLLAKTLAQTIGVPYYEDRIVERCLGYRLRSAPEEPLLDGPRYRYEGETLKAWPIDPSTGKAVPLPRVEFLTEEVWSRDHWPHTAGTVSEALGNLPDGEIEGLYYHGPSMCLVLLSPEGHKVGIRATALLLSSKLGPDKTAILALGKLKKKSHGAVRT
jgi:hypothetical protein